MTVYGNKGQQWISICDRRKGPDTPAELATILADLYKGEKEDLLRLNCREGYSMYNPIEWVRF